MPKSALLIALTAGLVTAPAAVAGVTDFGIDYDRFAGRVVVADGVLSPHEYGHNTQYFRGSGNGAGGVLGGSSSRLYYSTSDHGLAFGFQPGAMHTGTLVVMLNVDAAAGRPSGAGPGVAAINDTTDAARSAVSAIRGQYAAGFGDRNYDFAMTFNADGVGIWRLPDVSGSTLAQLGAYSGATGPGPQFREGVLPWSAISSGLVGDLSFFAAYVGDNGYLFNESFPSQPFTPGADPGPQFASATPADFSNSAVIGIFIPAPGALTFFALAGALSLRRRRSLANDHIA